MPMAWRQPMLKYTISKMKKIITGVVTIIIAGCLGACSKSGDIAPGLFGRWELRRMYGGFGYRDSIYAAGNGTIYQFGSDGTYKHYTKNQLDGHGNFSIKKKGYQLGQDYYDELLLDNNTTGDPITITNSKMTIGTTVTDGIATDYQKISN